MARKSLSFDIDSEPATGCNCCAEECKNLPDLRGGDFGQAVNITAHGGRKRAITALVRDNSSAFFSKKSFRQARPQKWNIVYNQRSGTQTLRESTPKPRRDPHTRHLNFIAPSLSVRVASEGRVGRVELVASHGKSDCNFGRECAGT